MTKAQLLDAVSKANGRMTKKQLNAVVDAVFMTIAAAARKNSKRKSPARLYVAK